MCVFLFVLIAGPSKYPACVGRVMPSLDTSRRVRWIEVISGHVHFARGAVKMQSTLLVNGANCGSGKEERLLANGPLVIDL